MRRHKFLVKQNFFLKEIKNLSRLYQKNNQLLTKIIRQKNSLLLDSSGIKYSKLFSYCLLSGRARFVNSKLFISRQYFKYNLEHGKLFGFYFSS